MVRRDLKLGLGVVTGSRGIWLNGELAPICIDIRLLVVHANVLHQMVSYGRVSAIGTNHEIKVDFYLLSTVQRSLWTSLLKPCLLILEVGSRELVIEEEFHIGHVFQDVQETLVEVCSVDSKDCLKLSE